MCCRGKFRCPQNVYQKEGQKENIGGVPSRRFLGWLQSHRSGPEENAGSAPHCCPPVTSTLGPWAAQWSDVQKKGAAPPEGTTVYIHSGWKPLSQWFITVIQIQEYCQSFSRAFNETETFTAFELTPKNWEKEEEMFSYWTNRHNISAPSTLNVSILKCDCLQS